MQITTVKLQFWLENNTLNPSFVQNEKLEAAFLDTGLWIERVRRRGLGEVEGGEDGVVDGEEEEELDLDVVGERPESDRRVAIDQDGGERNPKGEKGGCERL